MPIDGIYRPNPSQDDKDLAFLILQFGGPGLLDIVHRAIGFPSTSTAYKMIKGTTQMTSAIDVKTEDIINNIKINDDLPTYGHMLKMDETYCDAKVRWCPLDNKLYGFCNLHGKYLNLEFNLFENVNMLYEKLDKDEIHVPKECMVMAVSSNSYKKNAHPVLIWPTCSKSEVNIQMELIQTLSDGFYFKNNAPFMCWSTDGDATRRQIF